MEAASKFGIRTQVQLVRLATFLSVEPKEFIAFVEARSTRKRKIVDAGIDDRGHNATATCDICGQSYPAQRNLQLHKAHKHGSFPDTTRAVPAGCTTRPRSGCTGPMSEQHRRKHGENTRCGTGGQSTAVSLEYNQIKEDNARLQQRIKNMATQLARADKDKTDLIQDNTHKDKCQTELMQRCNTLQGRLEEWEDLLQRMDLQMKVWQEQTKHPNGQQ